MSAAIAFLIAISITGLFLAAIAYFGNPKDVIYLGWPYKVRIREMKKTPGKYSAQVKIPFSFWNDIDYWDEGKPRKYAEQEAKDFMKKVDEIRKPKECYEYGRINQDSRQKELAKYKNAKNY